MHKELIKKFRKELDNLIIGKRGLEDKTTTPGSYTLLLSGKALTKTQVVAR